MARTNKRAKPKSVKAAKPEAVTDQAAADAAPAATPESASQASDRFAPVERPLTVPTRVYRYAKRRGFDKPDVIAACEHLDITPAHIHRDLDADEVARLDKFFKVR